MNDAVEPFSLRMYIAGEAPNSVRALANLAQLRERHLPVAHVVEIVDITLEPHRALTDGVFMTPTLMKLAPKPMCRIVGTVSDLQPVLAALGLDRA